MRKYVVLLCVAASLVAVGALAADLQAATAIMATREVDPDIARVYDGLLQKRLSERVDALTQLPSSERAAVWVHHLLTALADHPEFTKDQRAVIQYAVSILSPQFMSTNPSDPQWEQIVGGPLNELKRRAPTVFTRKQMRDLFGQLGPERPDAHSAPTNIPYTIPSTGKTPRVAPLDVINVPQCACSTSHDFCDWSGLGFYYCRYGGCWPRESGCGWFNAQLCNGLCTATSSGGGGG